MNRDLYPTRFRESLERTEQALTVRSQCHRDKEKPPKWVNEAFALESLATALRNATTPEEWLANIQFIPDINLRNRVGCLIWWDTIGRMENAAEITRQFMPYILSKYVHVEPELVAMELWRCGYSAYSAHNRARLNKGYVDPATIPPPALHKVKYA